MMGDNPLCSSVKSSIVESEITVIEKEYFAIVWEVTILSTTETYCKTCTYLTNLVNKTNNVPSTSLYRFFTLNNLQNKKNSE